MAPHLKAYIDSTEQLCEYCELPVRKAPYKLDFSASYQCRVPCSYADKIRKGDWLDPLLLQVLPRAEETAPPPCGYSSDPVGDTDSTVSPGVIHKYHGRILLITTQSCAIHCRFCFRRMHCTNAVPADGSSDDSIKTYILEKPDITEVILSGGDPLTLDPERFERLVAQLLSIDQLTTVRLHTRAMIVAPDTVSTRHLTQIKAIADKKRCSIITHCNHPRELGNDNHALITRLHRTGAILLNQSVLLKGINDSVIVQKKLADALLAHKIVPYYLHQLDRVTGAHHFEVPVAEGCSLVEKLRDVQPGYATARYVKEVAGEKSKRMLL